MKPWVPAAVALANSAFLFGLPSAAQEPAGQAWTNCYLTEALPGGGQLRYQSNAGPGWPEVKPGVTWSSGPPGLGGPLHLNMAYGPGSTGAPNSALVFFNLGSAPKPLDYKVVFEFEGAGPQAALPLSGSGPILTNSSLRLDPAQMAGFARGRRVTATVYEGDQEIFRRAFDLAPEHRTAGLEAFARRVGAKDPSICRAASGPPLPVPPVIHHHLDDRTPRQ